MSEVVIVDEAKNVVEEVKNVVVEEVVTEVNGRTFGCDCGGWHIALQTSRIPKVPPPSKSEESVSKDDTSSVPSAPQKE